MKKVYKYWYLFLAGAILFVMLIVKLIVKLIGNECDEKKTLNMLAGHYKFVVDKLKYKIHRANNDKRKVWGRYGKKLIILITLLGLSRLNAEYMQMTPDGLYDFGNITNCVQAQSEYIVLQAQEVDYMNMQLSVQSNYIGILEKSKGIEKKSTLQIIWEDIRIPLFLVVGFIIGSRK